MLLKLQADTNSPNILKDLSEHASATDLIKAIIAGETEFKPNELSIAYNGGTYYLIRDGKQSPNIEEMINAISFLPNQNIPQDDVYILADMQKSELYVNINA